MTSGVYARQAAIVIPRGRPRDRAGEGFLLTDKEAEPLARALPESTGA
ncbi:hypothetical protein [Nocardia sp. alder85J]|nr:hypothetical protein [Nocardia sp. alder85J]MCX4094467.1 hypothetical protein [Nocardia sp. alder85J]